MTLPSDDIARAKSGDKPAPELSDIERQILNSLHQIRFGSLEIIVHDSRVVQIERSEKLRFDAKGRPLTDSLS